MAVVLNTLSSINIEIIIMIIIIIIIVTGGKVIWSKKIYIKWYRSRTDFRHRLTVINMNDTPVPIGQMHSFHSYV